MCVSFCSSCLRCMNDKYDIGCRERETSWRDSSYGLCPWCMSSFPRYRNKGHGLCLVSLEQTLIVDFPSFCILVLSISSISLLVSSDILWPRLFYGNITNFAVFRGRVKPHRDKGNVIVLTIYPCNKFVRFDLETRRSIKMPFLSWQ